MRDQVRMSICRSSLDGFEHVWRGTNSYYVYTRYMSSFCTRTRTRSSPALMFNAGATTGSGILQAICPFPIPMTVVLSTLFCVLYLVYAIGSPSLCVLARPPFVGKHDAAGSNEKGSSSSSDLTLSRRLAPASCCRAKWPGDATIAARRTRGLQCGPPSRLLSPQRLPTQSRRANADDSADSEIGGLPAAAKSAPMLRARLTPARGHTLKPKRRSVVRTFAQEQYTHICFCV